jgi:aminoglycoside phosphotransferase (APT) family kinase protein
MTDPTLKEPASPGRHPEKLTTHLDEETVRRQLEAWLPTKLPGAWDLVVKELKIPELGGYSAATILFDASWREHGRERERGFVARVAPAEPGTGLFMEYNLRREADLMMAMRRLSIVPVPSVVAVEDDPDVLGAPFLLTEFQSGRVPQDSPSYVAEGWVFDLDLSDQGRVFDQCLQMIAAIHSANPTELGVRDFESALDDPDPLGSLLDYWDAFNRWGRGDDRPHSAYDTALAWLRANKPTEPEPTVVNWGDARLGNLIFDEGLSVGAVLDWEMTCVGSPEIDLGWFLYHMRWTTASTGAPQLPGFPSREQAIARYEELSGHTVRYAHYYEVLASLRMVVLASRFGVILTAAGQLPPGNDFARTNAAPMITAELLGPSSRPSC